MSANPTLAAFIKRKQEEREAKEIKFPLRSLLILYLKSNRKDTYCEYFSGFKLLVSWLAPISIPTTPPTYKFSPVFYTYEQQEIARILGTSPHIIQSVLMEIYHEPTSD